jgi:DNA-binding Xre family transcriptional regulator
VDLAKKIGVSRQYANQIISRSKCGIRCDTLEKIVSALGYEIALVKIIEK